MKKSLLLVFAAALLSTSLMAGGIMTNTNQSAAYARMLARNACLGIDAVYYNPAGLTKLKNGFYLSLNNQSIFQTKDVTNNYPYLHDTPNALYTGKVSAPVFPGVYAVYKMDKLAFSFGFNPVGGGGGATYDKGLPSFEMAISDLVPSLKPTFGVTDYKADINFEGTSVYFGYQFGLSYEVCNSFSVFAGLRSVSAKNTYVGALRNIQINPVVAGTAYNGTFVKAKDFGTERAGYYSAVSAQYLGAAQGAAQLNAHGAGSLTFAQAKAMNLITATQQAQFEGALVAAGQSASTPIAQSQVIYGTVAKQTGDAAWQMNGLAAKTGDAEVDATQTGTGYTPIFGANMTFAEKLTVAIKYEMITKLTLTNETAIDGTGMFPNGATSRSDMPAMLSVGLSYPVTKKFVASLGINYYWDKTADYGKTSGGLPIANDKVIDKNFYEYAVGLEYNITDNFLVSAGYQGTMTGVSEAYQSDLSYSLSTGSVGGGCQIGFGDRFDLNLAGMYTKYKDGEKNYTHLLGATSVPVNEKYAKTTWLVAVGLDVRIGK